MINNHKYFFWSYIDQKNRHWYNLGTGLFIWLFLSFTLPFGMYDNNIEKWYLLFVVLLPYGLLWPMISYCVDWVSSIGHRKADLNFRRHFWLMVIKVFLLIHFVFFFRIWLAGWGDLQWSEYLEAFFGCLLLILLTYIPFSLHGKFTFYKSLLIPDKNSDESLVLLRGEQREEFAINPRSVIYFKADDNYIDIVHLDQELGPQKSVFRARLKWIETQLTPHVYIVRTHRSYLVNLNYLQALEANHIILKAAGQVYQIPVSRSYKDTLGKIIE